MAVKDKVISNEVLKAVNDNMQGQVSNLKTAVTGLQSDVTTAAADIEVLEANDALMIRKPTTNPNGTSGQVLRTNGDGTTTWITQGLPTDAQTATAVTAWLNDHPEATTTVQDGSITSAKLDSDFLDTVRNPFVTPQMFGAVGDGTTDDTESLQDAIDYCCTNGVDLVSPGNKTYAISSPLTIFNGTYNKVCFDFGYSTILAIDEITCMIKYNTGSSSVDNGRYQNRIENVVLDGDLLAATGYEQTYGRKVVLRNITVMDITAYGLDIKGGNILTDKLFINLQTTTNNTPVGIYIESGSSDCKIQNVYMRDMTTAIDDRGGSCFFFNVHAWLINASPSGSVFAHIESNAYFDMCFSDTYQLAFDIVGEHYITIANTSFYINPNYYNDSITTTPPKIFNFSTLDCQKYIVMMGCDINYRAYLTATSRKAVFANYTSAQLNDTRWENIINNNKILTALVDGIPSGADYFQKRFEMSAEYVAPTDTDIGTYAQSLNAGTYYISIPGYGHQSAMGLPANANMTGVIFRSSNFNSIASTIVLFRGNGTVYYKVTSSGTWSNWYQVTATQLS